MGGSGSGRKENILAKSQCIRYDLRDTLEHNYNLYQDALEAMPSKQHALKLTYDQYLKTVNLHRKDNPPKEEETVIEFKSC